MLFCSQCGARIPNNSKFCYKCGAKAVMPEWIEEEEDLEIPEEPAEKQTTDPEGTPAEHDHDHAAHDHAGTAGEKTADKEKDLPVPEETAPVPAPEKKEAVPAAETAAKEQAAPEEENAAAETKKPEEIRPSEEPGTAAAKEPAVTASEVSAAEEPKTEKEIPEVAAEHLVAEPESEATTVSAAEPEAEATTMSAAEPEAEATTVSVVEPQEEAAAVSVAETGNKEEPVSAESETPETSAPQTEEVPAEPVTAERLSPAEEQTPAVPEENAAEKTVSVQMPGSEEKDISGPETVAPEIPVSIVQEPDAEAAAEHGFTVLPDESPAEPAPEEEKKAEPETAAAAEPAAEEVPQSSTDLQVTDNSGFILPELEEYEPLEAYLPEETMQLAVSDLLTDDDQDPMLGVEYMTSVEEDLLRALEELRPVSSTAAAVQAEAAGTDKASPGPVEEAAVPDNSAEAPVQHTEEATTEAEEIQTDGADGPSQEEASQTAGISGLEDFNAVELAMQLRDEAAEETRPSRDAESEGQDTAEKLSDDDAEYLARFDSDPFGEDRDGGESTGQFVSADDVSRGEKVISAGIPPLPEIPSQRDGDDIRPEGQTASRADTPIERHRSSHSGSSRSRSDGKRSVGLLVFIAVLALVAGFLGYYLSRPDTRYLRHMRKAADAESRGDIAVACEEYNLALEVMPESLQASEKLKDYWLEVSEKIGECTRRSQFREAAEQAKILKSIYPGREEEIAELTEKIYASWAAASVMTGNVNDVNYVLDLASAELDRERYENVVARSEDATARYRYAEDFTAAGKRILELNESGDRTAVFEQMDMFLQTVADYASQGGSFPVRTGSDTQGRQAAFYLDSGTDLQVYIGYFSDEGDREGTADSYAVFSGGSGTEYEFSTCEWAGDVPSGSFRATEYGNSIYDGEDRTAEGTLREGFYDGNVTITIPGGKSYKTTFENGSAVIVSAEAPDGRRNVIGYTADGKDWYCISDAETGSRFGILFVR